MQLTLDPADFGRLHLVKDDPEDDLLIIEIDLPRGLWTFGYIKPSTTFHLLQNTRVKNYFFRAFRDDP